MSNLTNDQLFEEAIELSDELGENYIQTVARLVHEGDLRHLYWLVKDEMRPLVQAQREVERYYEKHNLKGRTHAK
jgi:hypothetical protein